MTKEEGGRTEPFLNEGQMVVYSKTWDCATYVEIHGKDMAMPGEDVTLTFKFNKPMVMGEASTLHIERRQDHHWYWKDY